MPLDGCERGCARSWVLGRSSGTRETSQAGPWNAIDCPDGLARCEAGVVSVSVLATVPQPCSGPQAQCACPWEVIGECERGCTVDGLDLVVDRRLARAQLCAPPAGAAPLARPTTAARAAPCEEGQRYACRGGFVVECVSSSSVGLCDRGCYAEGASIDDDGIGREAAFALLCSH